MPSKLILNEELPKKIRRALDSAARKDDITVNDAAVRVICDHFKLPWTRSRARFRPVADRFKLRVSEDLHQRIRIEAAMRYLTVRAVVLDILGAHFGTPNSVPAGRRRRKEKA